MHEPNIVILAGGISSRMKKSAAGAADRILRDEAASKPKSMIGIGAGRRPFLDYLLYNVQSAGYHDVVLVIGGSDARMHEYYDQKDKPVILKDLEIRFAVQKIPPGRSKPLGTADALLCALESRSDWKSQQLTVCNSDNLYSIDALRLLRESSAPNALIKYDFTALRFPPDRIRQFAIIRTDAEDYLTDIIEKPSDEQLKSVAGNPGVSMNIFRFSYDDILPFLNSVPLHPERGEKELPEAVRMLVKARPRSVRTYDRAEVVPDLTTVDDIPAVQQFIRENFADM